MTRDNVKIYHVDAFADAPFCGNPAAVCIVKSPISEQLMQNIAQEVNLSETAFVTADHHRGCYDIRWFTPELEVDLCGHATLAAAKVLFEKYDMHKDYISFSCKSGSISALRLRDEIMLDFPADEVEQEISCSIELLQALGFTSCKKAVIGRKTRKLVIHVEEAEQVALMEPDFAKLKAIGFDVVVKGIGVTAKGSGEYDIVSRYFNPWAGVNEDPVTGSVHTLLGPYWREILNKKELFCFQASKRGGKIRLKIAESSRIELWGKAVIVAAGELCI